MKNNCININDNKAFNYQCIDHMNRDFTKLSAIERIEHAAAYLPSHFAMTSSFGIDAAVSLHLINQVIPGIVVILIDTGYLFKETYQYAEQLSESLKLNLKIYQSPVSTARFESKYGELWLDGLSGIEQYNQLRKVRPLEQALVDQEVNTWFSGIRRNQSSHRQNLPWISLKQDRYKIHPILDWNDRDIYQYMKNQKLPQHPLSEQGYLTVGDTHSTKSIHEVDRIEELRFFGLKRECGIHE